MRPTSSVLTAGAAPSGSAVAVLLERCPVVRCGSVLVAYPHVGGSGDRRPRTVGEAALSDEIRPIGKVCCTWLAGSRRQPTRGRRRNRPAAPTRPRCGGGGAERARLLELREGLDRPLGLARSALRAGRVASRLTSGRDEEGVPVDPRVATSAQPWKRWTF